MKSISVAEAAEKMFARAKDVDGLYEAVATKLSEQRRFVLWWDGQKLNTLGNATIADRRQYPDNSTIHCAVLCKHSVPLSERRAIDTRHDIESFQIMIYDPHIPDLLATTEHFVGNDRWQNFVQRWYRSPSSIRTYCIESAINVLEVA